MTPSPSEKHIVHDYEFFMANGQRHPFTIDETLGDTLTFTSSSVIIHISEKPSRNNPDFKIPGEDFEINRTNINMQAHRTRQVSNNPALKDPIFASFDPPQVIQEGPLSS